MSQTYELRDIGGGGKARRVEFKEDNEIEFEKLTYSTCRPENLDWYLTASRMDVEQDTQTAVGTNAVLHFFEVPILYTPVFSLPTGSGRRSGFLISNLRPCKSWWRERLGHHGSLLCQFGA